MAALHFLGEGTSQAYSPPAGPRHLQGLPPWLAGLITYPHPAHVAQLILVSHGVFQDLEE